MGRRVARWQKLDKGRVHTSGLESDALTCVATNSSPLITLSPDSTPCKLIMVAHSDRRRKGARYHLPYKDVPPPGCSLFDHGSRGSMSVFRGANTNQIGTCLNTRASPSLFSSQERLSSYSGQEKEGKKGLNDASASSPSTAFLSSPPPSPLLFLSLISSSNTFTRSPSHRGATSIHHRYPKPFPLYLRIRHLPL